MPQQRQKKTETLTLSAGRTVRGYEVRRLPIGGYLRALGLLEEAPEQLVQACFPGSTSAQVLTALAKADKGLLVQVALRVLEVAPAFAVRAFAELSGIPEQRLLDDAAIGLDGLVELMEAWAEVNGVGNFLSRLRDILSGPLQTLTGFRKPGTGSSA